MPSDTREAIDIQLMTAVRNGEVDTLKQLIKNGANVNCKECVSTKLIKNLSAYMDPTFGIHIFNRYALGRFLFKLLVLLIGFCNYTILNGALRHTGVERLLNAYVYKVIFNQETF